MQENNYDFEYEKKNKKTKEVLNKNLETKNKSVDHMKDELQWMMTDFLKLKRTTKQDPKSKEMPRYVFVVFKTMNAMACV